VQANDLDPALLEDAHHFMPKCDILFIDTSHAYMHTLRELEAWMPFVRPGGTVLLHDTEYDPQPVEVGGVPQPKWPVSVALSEYCGARGLKWENHTGCNGLGVIRIPGGPCP
jgi:cephalosporin hydroxylase